MNSLDDTLKKLETFMNNSKILIETLNNCVGTASKILATTYKDVGDLIKYCHRLCMSCATECEKHEHQHCVECAEACRKCAAACKDTLVKYETSNIQQDENYF